MRFHVLGVLLCLAGCGDDGDDTGGLPSNVSEAVTNYSSIVHATYEDSLSAVQDMNTALEALVADPTDSNLESAKDAWLDARIPYLQTEVYRFYDGPIDGADGEPEGMINAWPMDEQSVDYVDGMPMAGRINDSSFTISASALGDANGEGGETDVASGFHPIEFLLWGQDLTDPEMEMPGQRPVSDYDTADNADRRGEYLVAAGQHLEGLLSGLVDEWATGGGNYRAELEEAEAADSLQKILTGMIVLSGFETGGERLQAALDAGDQEEEHSCFSDNTHNDMIYDVIGVQNVWRGSYGSVSGTGVRDVVQAVDSDLADALDEQIDMSVQLAMAIEPPFDLEIMPGNTDGNARIQALIDSLRMQEMLLTDVFVELGFTVPNPE